MHLSLSIIIVHYKVPYFLEHCLFSIKDAIKNLNDVQIIVVDNATFPIDNEIFEKKFPDIQFIYLKENVGFGRANNEALKYVNSDLVLFLNPDTLLAESSLMQSITQFENDRNVGGLGLRMLDGSGRFLPESKRSIPTFSVSLMKLTGLSSLFPNSGLFNKYALGNISENSNCTIEVIAGAYLMARTAVIKSIYGYDERFFMYGEDIDLSQQILLKGYQNYYLGSESIIHFKGESTKQNKSKHIKVFYEAMILYVEKYYKNLNKLLFKSFFQMVVQGRALFDKVGNKVVNSNTFQPKAICLLGEVASFDKATHILNKNISEFKLVEQANILQADTVLFCVGENWTYSDAINFIQKNTTKFQYLFYKKDSAIIGSNDKKETGIQWI